MAAACMDDGKRPQDVFDHTDTDEEYFFPRSSRQPKALNFKRRENLFDYTDTDDECFFPRYARYDEQQSNHFNTTTQVENVASKAHEYLEKRMSPRKSTLEDERAVENKPEQQTKKECMERIQFYMPNEEAGYFSKNNFAAKPGTKCPIQSDEEVHREMKEPRLAESNGKDCFPEEVAKMGIIAIHSASLRSLKSAARKYSREAASQLQAAWQMLAGEQSIACTTQVLLSVRAEAQICDLAEVRIILCDLLALQLACGAGVRDRFAYFAQPGVEALDVELQSQLAHAFGKLSQGLPAAFVSKAKEKRRGRPRRKKKEVVEVVEADSRQLLILYAEQFLPRTEGCIAALEPTLCYYDFPAADIATLVNHCHHYDVELRIAMASVVQDGGAAKIKEVSEPSTVVTTCRVCGKTYSWGAKFCRECGAHEEDPEHPHLHGGVKPVYTSGFIAALWHDPSYSYASRLTYVEEELRREAENAQAQESLMRMPSPHRATVVDAEQYSPITEGCIAALEPTLCYYDFSTTLMKQCHHDDVAMANIVQDGGAAKIKEVSEPSTVVTNCRVCGKTYPRGAKFCSECEAHEEDSEHPHLQGGVKPVYISAYIDALWHDASFPHRCVGLSNLSTFTELERHHSFFAFSGGSQNSWSTDLEGQRDPWIETVTASQNDDDMSRLPLSTPASPWQRQIGFNDDSGLLPSLVSSVSGRLRGTANPGAPDSRSPYASQVY